MYNMIKTLIDTVAAHPLHGILLLSIQLSIGEIIDG